MELADSRGVVQLDKYYKAGEARGEASDHKACIEHRCRIVVTSSHAYRPKIEGSPRREGPKPGDIERETGLLRYPTCQCLGTVFRFALLEVLCGKCRTSGAG